VKQADIHKKNSKGAKSLKRPNTLNSILVSAVKNSPNAPYLYFEGKCWTYRNVDDAVNRTAKALLELGVMPGDRIAIWMSNRPEWVIAQYATTRLGAVLVPLNTRLRRDDLAYALNDSGARAIFTQASTDSFSYTKLLNEILDADQCPELKHILVAREQGADLAPLMTGWTQLQDIGTNSSLQPSPAVNPDDMAYIVYTSGTTSAPKGVMLSHTNLNNSYNYAGNYLEDDIIFVAYPMFAVTGCHNSVLGSAIAGASLVLQERFDSAEALTLIEKYKCTVYNGMTDTIKAISQVPEFKSAHTKSLRHANVFPRRPEHRPLFKLLNFVTAGTGYGMTETSGPVTNALDTVEDFALGEGKPWAGNLIRLVDPENNDVKQGDVGAILVSSSQLMLGYFNKPEATQKAINSEGWLCTGDMGYFSPDGVLVWSGRNDDVYKTSGFNVSGLEVESFLSAYPNLANVAVIGVPDDKKGMVGAAFIIPKLEGEITLKDIQSFCSGKIASHKIPGHVISLTSFPLTPNGKVRKLQLREEHFS